MEQSVEVQFLSRAQYLKRYPAAEAFLWAKNTKPLFSTVTNIKKLSKKVKKLLLEQALKAHKVINTIPWQDHGQFIAEFASKHDAPDNFLLEGTVSCGKNGYGCGISGKLKIILNSRPEFDKTKDGHFFRVYDPLRATIDYDLLMKSLNTRDAGCKVLIPE